MRMYTELVLVSLLMIVLKNLHRKKRTHTHTPVIPHQAYTRYAVPGIQEQQVTTTHNRSDFLLVVLASIVRLGGLARIDSRLSRYRFIPHGGLGFDAAHAAIRQYTR